MEIMEAVSLGVKNLCKTFRFKLEDGVKLGKNVYGASIPIFKGKEEYQFYLYFKKDILKLLAKKFFKTEMNEDDFSDIAREVANQIIGFAKNELNDKNNFNCKLGTPEFLGKVESFHVKFIDSKIYKIKNRTFKIGFTKV